MSLQWIQVRGYKIMTFSSLMKQQKKHSLIGFITFQSRDDLEGRQQQYQARPLDSFQHYYGRTFLRYCVEMNLSPRLFFFFNFESRPATFLGDILRPLFLHSAKSEKWRRKLWWNIQKKLPKTKKKLDQITASGWQCRQNAPDFRRPSCKKERKERLIDRLVPFNWNRAKTVSRYGKDDFVAIFFIILFCSTPLMSHGRSRCPFLPSFTEFYRVFFCSFSSILF